MKIHTVSHIKPTELRDVCVICVVRRHADLKTAVLLNKTVLHYDIKPRALLQHDIWRTGNHSGPVGPGAVGEWGGESIMLC